MRSTNCREPYNEKSINQWILSQETHPHTLVLLHRPAQCGMRYMSGHHHCPQDHVFSYRLCICLAEGPSSQRSTCFTLLKLNARRWTVRRRCISLTALGLCAHSWTEKKAKAGCIFAYEVTIIRLTCDSNTYVCSGWTPCSASNERNAEVGVGSCATSPGRVDV